MCHRPRQSSLGMSLGSGSVRIGVGKRSCGRCGGGRSLHSRRVVGGQENRVWCKMADGSLHHRGVQFGQVGAEGDGSVVPQVSSWDIEGRKQD